MHVGREPSVCSNRIFTFKTHNPPPISSPIDLSKPKVVIPSAHSAYFDVLRGLLGQGVLSISDPELSHSLSKLPSCKMSASKSSGQLLDHLQALLGQSRRHASESVWTDLLDTWQATGIPVRVEKEEPQIEVPVGIPLPTLLDYYNPPALGARLDDPTNHAISFRPSGSGAGGYGDYAEDQVSNEQDSDAAELTERLQK
jgi:hypothetical protein